MLRPLAVLAVCVALCPAADPPAKDAAGDPLPQGAIARLGTERMRGFRQCYWHPDGKRLIVQQFKNASSEVESFFVDPATGKRLGDYAGGSGHNIADLSADGKRGVTHRHGVLGGLSSGPLDALVWDAEKGEVRKSIRLTTKKTEVVLGPYPSLHLSADGTRLAVGCEIVPKGKKPTVRVFDVEREKLIAEFAVPQKERISILLSADGKRAVSWADSVFGQDLMDSPDRLIQFWDVDEKKELHSWRLSGRDGPRAVAFAPAGDVAAASADNGTVALFDVTTGKPLKDLVSAAEVGWMLTFSPDGKKLAAVGTDGTVQLWDVATGKSLGLTPPPITQLKYESVSVAFTAAGEASALTKEENRQAAIVWALPSGKLISPDAGHHSPLSGVAFSADDKEILTGGANGEVIRWSRDGKRLGDVALTGVGRVSPLPTRSPVRIPADGLLARPATSRHEVFSSVTGKRMMVVPTDSNSCVPAFSPDGKRMVTSERSEANKKEWVTRLVVYDVAAGTREREIKFGSDDVRSVIVSPDGKTAGVVRWTYPDDRQRKLVYCGVNLDTGDILGESDWTADDPTIAPDNKTLVAYQDAPNPGGRLALYNLPRGELALFDLATGKRLREYTPIESAPTAGLTFSRDGKRLALALHDAKGVRIEVYDWETGKRTHQFGGHLSAATVLAVSNDGKLLASGSLDTTVLLWDLSK